MSLRSRKEQKKYNAYLAHSKNDKTCPFCVLGPKDNQYLSETRSFIIVKALAPYTQWDNQNVTDHLIIVPKVHTDALGKLTSSEMLEFMDLVGSYESRGYNIWARAPQTITKSITHQHTHLIKPGKKIHKFILYSKKPYLRFLR